MKLLRGDRFRRTSARSLLLFMVLTGAPALGEEPKESTIGGLSTTTDSVPVLFATIRARTESDSPDEFYDGRRGDWQAGICTMEFTSIPGLSEFTDSFSFYVPSEKTTIRAVERHDEEAFWGLVDAAAESQDRRLVVYVHGYNIGFVKSCRDAALFQRSQGLNGGLVLFSWPADGNVLNYTLDESDLAWSVGYMESGLRRLVDRLGPGKIDIVAHSLGARGITSALARIGCGESKSPLINELILVAPDIDSAIFKRDLESLSPLANRITVYASENDRALWLSKEVHGYPRLGQAGPDLTPMEGIELIDVSLLGAQRFSGHLYHLFDSTVSKDIRQVLESGTPADERESLHAAERAGKRYWRMVPPAEG